MSEELAPVPGWPGYLVNAAGEAFSRYGALEADARGRYMLRNGNTRKRLSPQDLLALAAGARPALPVKKPQPVPAEAPKPVERKPDEPEAWKEQLEASLAAAKKTIAKLEAELRKADRAVRHHRRQNAKFWQILRRLEAEFTAEPARKARLQKLELAESEINEIMAGTDPWELSWQE